MSLLLVNDSTLSTDTTLENKSVIDHNNLNYNIEKNNNDSEFNDIEENVNNMMNTQKNNDELCKVDIFKNLLLTLQNQIDTLTEEVKFLRKDSINKSEMINNLIDITKIIHTKREVNTGAIIRNESTQNEASIDNVSKSNQYISNNRLNNNNLNINKNSENRQNLQKMLNDLSHSPPIINSTGYLNESHGYYRFPPFLEKNEQINDITPEIMCGGDSSFNIDVHEMPSNEEYILNSIYDKPMANQSLWKNGTTLIIGDSLLNGIDESKLVNAKVRIYPGASVDDMFYNIFPLLRKTPSNVIIYAGTNNAKAESSTQIIEKLSNLQDFIVSILANCKVVFSQLIHRVDDGKAQLTVKVTNEKMTKIGLCVLDNSNITQDHLGKKGLHICCKYY